MYKNTGEIGFLLNKRKKLKPFIHLGLSLLEKYDPDWVRTSAPPVKEELNLPKQKGMPTAHKTVNMPSDPKN